MCELSGQWLQFLAWLCIAPVICAAGLCGTAARGSSPALMSSPRGRACASGGGTVLQPCCCFGNQFVDCAQVQLAQAAVPAWLLLAVGACPSAAWWPQSRVEDEAGWQLRLAGCMGCSKGELSPRPGLGRSTGMVRPVQVSHTHSPFSSLGAQPPVSSQLMGWECILQAAGLSFVMTQRAGESQGLAAANHASQYVGEVGAEALRCRGTSWGCWGEVPTLLLAPPVVCPCDWGGGCTPATWSEPAPAPGLGSSVRLPPLSCWEVQQNKNLNSCKIY